METATKNRGRGRPRAFTGAEKVYYDILNNGYSQRTTTNSIYEAIGYDVILKTYPDDEDADMRRIFTNYVRFFKQGVLQQLGRMQREGCTKTQLTDAARLAVDLLQDGQSSKEVERTLREIRKYLREGANA